MPKAIDHFVRNEPIVTLNRTGLTLLNDSEGSVAIGWVGEGVLYSRCEGGLSAKLGGNYANHLESLIRQIPRLEYFVDGSALVQYDLLARSAFVRVVLAHRRKFETISILTWREGISTAASRFTDALGGDVQLIAEKAEFSRRLMDSAPRAHQLLAASDAYTKSTW
jgi:hypothetical protein